MGEANKRAEREAAEERANHEELVREARALFRMNSGYADCTAAQMAVAVAQVAAILAVRDAVLDLPDVYLERVEELAREAEARASGSNRLHLTAGNPRDVTKPR